MRLWLSIRMTKIENKQAVNVSDLTILNIVFVLYMVNVQKF